MYVYNNNNMDHNHLVAYMAHVCFYVCCCDCVEVCGNVCCVAPVAKDIF